MEFNGTTYSIEVVGVDDARLQIRRLAGLDFIIHRDILHELKCHGIIKNYKIIREVEEI